MASASSSAGPKPSPIGGEILERRCLGEAALKLTDVDLTVFVSCYNEQEHIVATLQAIEKALAGLETSYEIIVIDDHSGDKSAELVGRHIAEGKKTNIFLKRNAANRGLARNYVDGAFLGAGRYYRLVCGDNAEPAETMAALFGLIGRADMLIPYYVSVEGKSLYRKAISSAYTTIINLVSGHRLHYYNGLAVLPRYHVMRWHSNTRGFGFQAELVTLLLDQDFSFLEVPCKAAESRRGKSGAINMRNALSVSHSIFDILIRRLLNKVY